MKKLHLILILIAIIILIGGGWFFFQQRQHLPTKFKAPTPDGAPHIVGAKIKAINVKECDGCTIEIFDSMDGVSDEVINEVNGWLTVHIFSDIDETKDVRLTKNQKVPSDITIDSFKDKIVYYDSSTKVVGYTSTFAIFDARSAHPGIESDDYNYLIISNDGKEIWSEPVIFFDDAVKVLEHFYPNFQELYEKWYAINGDPDDDICKKSDSGEYEPTLHPLAREVIFRVEWPYVSKTCGYGYDLNVAIPIDDILKEVPQYIPKDSVLWRFKKD